MRHCQIVWRLRRQLSLHCRQYCLVPVCLEIRGETTNLLQRITNKKGWMTTMGLLGSSLFLSEGSCFSIWRTLYSHRLKDLSFYRSSSTRHIHITYQKVTDTLTPNILLGSLLERDAHISKTYEVFSRGHVHRLGYAYLYPTVRTAPYLASTSCSSVMRAKTARPWDQRSLTRWHQRSFGSDEHSWKVFFKRTGAGHASEYGMPDWWTDTSSSTNKN